MFVHYLSETSDFLDVALRYLIATQVLVYIAAFAIISYQSLDGFAPDEVEFSDIKRTDEAPN